MSDRAETKMKPSIGSLVYYVLASGTYSQAIVTRVYVDGCVDLRLPRMPLSPKAVHRVEEDPMRRVGSWYWPKHWPKREGQTP